jgi:hypothetical protein
MRKPSSTPLNHWSRRSLLRAAASAALASIAGCGGGGAGFPRPADTTVKLANGYADRQSYRPGDTVTLFLSTDFPQAGLLSLRDYAGKVVFQFRANVFHQDPVGDKPWETGFGYQDSVSFVMPGLPSGVYLVEGIIPLIVKSSLFERVEVVIVYPTNTMAAYNAAGGRSLYSTPVPATAVSFLRPAQGDQVSLFAATLEWLAQAPLAYSVRYIADIDLEDFNEISGSKLLMVIGHSEYWTRRARENFDQYVQGGGHALLLSGNNMWWQVRYSEDRTQMLCYKRAPDPISDPLLKTVTWPDKTLQYPTLLSVGADFVHGGFGLQYPKESSGFYISSPHSPVFEGVFVRAGDLLSIPTLEYDGAPLLNHPATQGKPMLDMDALDAYRAEIIGYALCDPDEKRSGSSGSIAENVGTWIAYQRQAGSGVVLNGASTNWCSRSGAFGKDGYRVRKVIRNMVDILAQGRQVFVT